MISYKNSNTNCDSTPKQRAYHQTLPLSTVSHWCQTLMIATNPCQQSLLLRWRVQLRTRLMRDNSNGIGHNLPTLLSHPSKTWHYIQYTINLYNQMWSTIWHHRMPSLPATLWQHVSNWTLPSTELNSHMISHKIIQWNISNRTNLMSN